MLTRDELEATRIIRSWIEEADGFKLELHGDQPSPAVQKIAGVIRATRLRTMAAVNAALAEIERD